MGPVSSAEAQSSWGRLAVGMIGAISVAGVLAACSTGTAEPADEGASSPTSASTSATDVPGAAPSAAPPITTVAKGQMATSDGLEITVLDAWTQKTLTYEGNTYSEETPNGKKRTITAPQDGRYLYVKTTGTNNTRGGLDMTCDWVGDFLAVDSQGRKFEEADGLSQLKGNPGCNDMVSPGFKFNMTWVYLVPPGAQITTWNWRAVTGKNYKSGPRVQVNLESVEERG